jgi:hypothetical protein
MRIVQVVLRKHPFSLHRIRVDMVQLLLDHGLIKAFPRTTGKMAWELLDGFVPRQEGPGAGEEHPGR